MAGWYNGIRLEDTCPECNRAQANQILGVDNKVDLYICLRCGHEWSPSVKEIGFDLGVKEFVIRARSAPTAEAIDRAGAAVARKFEEVLWMRSKELEENKSS